MWKKWFTLAHAEPSFAKWAPFRLEYSASVPGTPREVFDVLADDQSWHRWFPSLEEVRWTSAPPPGRGSTREVQLELVSLRERFTIWEPAERMAFSVSSMTLPLVNRMMEDYKLRPTRDHQQTRLEWLVYYEPRGPLRPLRPVLEPVFDWMFKRALGNLSGYMQEQLGH